MIVHFIWPIAGALTISTVLASSLAGWILTDGGKLSDAARKGSRLFLVLISLQSVAYLVLVAWVWGRKTLSMNRESPAPQKPRRGRKDRVLAINTGGGTPLKSLGQKMQDRIDEVRDAQRARSKAPSYAQNTKFIEAKVQEPEEYSLLEELYDVTHEMYGKSLSRESFEEVYVGGQGVHRKFQEYWTDLGWVDFDGRGTMAFKYPEAELYKDRGLRWMAGSKGFEFPPPLPH